MFLESADQVFSSDGAEICRGTGLSLETCPAVARTVLASGFPGGTERNWVLTSALSLSRYIDVLQSVFAMSQLLS